MQICHSLKWSICQRQINRQQFFKVMPEYLYGFSEVIPRCWNFILFKTNSLYFHDLFITTFAFISWILLALLKSEDKKGQMCKRNERSVGRREGRMRHLHWCCLRPHKASSGADYLEHTTVLYSCHGIFKDQSIFRSNFPGMKLPWECHDQSLETNLTSLRHWSGTAFLSQKKRYTKNRSVCKNAVT